MTNKIAIIMHTALQDNDLNYKVSVEINKKEHLLNPFNKRASDAPYDIKMYSIVSELYLNYIKYFANVNLKTKVLMQRVSKLSDMVQDLTMEGILESYQYIDGLLT